MKNIEWNKNSLDLKRGPLSLASTFQKLFERKSSGFSLKIENTDVGIRHTNHVALSIRKCWN
jgi:hypothetical protein